MPEFMELELHTFDEASIQRKGGVAWAKQVAAAMDPGAVGLQITGYQQAAEQIAYAQKVLKNTQGNLDASWTGQAATAAQQTFQGSVDHAQRIQDTINQDIVPHLQTVQQAQQEFIDTMMNVPDEKPLTPEAQHYLLWKEVMNFPPNYPGKVLLDHNTAARTQTAAALTTLAGKYSGAAAKLNELGGSSGSIFENQANTSTFNLGPVTPASGTGSAARYRSSVHATSNISGSRSNPPGIGSSGSVTAVGGGTQLASSPSGGNPPSDGNPISGSPTLPNPVRNPNPGPVGGQPIDVLPVGTQPPGSGGYGEGSDPITGGRRGGSTGYGGEPGESELIGRTPAGSGQQRLVGGSNEEVPGEYGNTAVRQSAATGAAEGETSPGAATEGMGPLGGMGAGGRAGAGGQSPDSSRYNRGRYFDEAEDGEESPAPSVRSVFEDATDGQGNRLNLLSRRGAAERDDDDERRKRTSYPKEDGLWDSAQRIVPPVIE